MRMFERMVNTDLAGRKHDYAVWRMGKVWRNVVTMKHQFLAAKTRNLGREPQARHG